MPSLLGQRSRLINGCAFDIQKISYLQLLTVVPPILRDALRPVNGRAFGSWKMSDLKFMVDAPSILGKHLEPFKDRAFGIWKMSYLRLLAVVPSILGSPIQLSTRPWGVTQLTLLHLPLQHHHLSYFLSQAHNISTSQRLNLINSAALPAFTY